MADKKLSPIVAFLLNVCFAPAGYVYVGNARLGIIIWLALALCSFAAVFLSFIYPPGIYALMASPGAKIWAALVIPIGLGLHGASLARKSRPTLQGPRFWVAIIGLPLILITTVYFIGPFWPYPDFVVRSESGLPTLMPDDVVVTRGAKNTCGAANDQRGDLVVYRKGNESNIKRLVGLPGDMIQINQGVLLINERAVQQQFQGHASVKIAGNPTQAELNRETLPNGKSYSIYLSDRAQPSENIPAFKLAQDQYFLLGDNRDNSLDSRFDGPSSKNQLCSVVIKIVDSHDPSHIGQRP